MTHHRSPAGGRAGRWALALTLAGLLPVLAAPAAASADSPLTCRGSAAHVTALSPTSPLANVEPIRANANGTPCSSQSAETLKPTTIGPLKADALEAYTSAPTGAGAAFGGASHPSLTLGGLTVAVDAVQSSANVTCTNGDPVLSGASRVVGLTVNGTTIKIPNGDQPFRLNVGAADLRLNEQTVANGTLTQRAVHLIVPNVADAVLGEAIAGGTKDACASAQTPVTPTEPKVCPSGATFDAARGVCVIQLPGTDRVIVIGAPYTGPSGGLVLPLPTARKRYHSPCLSGPGLPYAVVGTNRANRITGTNGNDRILLLAGNDQGDGGRGNDCVDGGSGKDLLSGALGADRLYGGTGNDRIRGGSGADRIFGGAGADRLDGDVDNDHMDGGAGNDSVTGGPGNDWENGGTGNDRVLGLAGNDTLYGGRGNDQVRAGYGHDRLYGGPGRDFLGAFLFGPIVRTVDGGSGWDRAWVNPRELRDTRNVERVRIFRARG